MIRLKNNPLPFEIEETKTTVVPEEKKRASKVRLKMGKRINRVSVVDPATMDTAEEIHYNNVKS